MTMRRAGWVAAGAALAWALSGCGTTDESTGCTADYMCAVGEVCEGATADADGTCTAAATDAERTFGAATLDFANGDEVYLVSVYDVPTAAAVADDTALFTLQGTGASATLQRTSAALTEEPADAALWKARLAFDARRYESIQKTSSVAGAPVTTSRNALQATCGDCGASAFCFQGSCVSQAALTFTDGSTSVTCDLAGVVAAGAQSLNVLVDSREAASSAAAVSVAQAFASTLAAEQSLLGVTGRLGELDRDGDGRLNLVFTNQEAGVVTTDLVGFFDNRDFLASGVQGATGNEMDILWARLPGTSNTAGLITEQLAVGTLAHEYTHLTSYATRVWARAGDPLPQESLWLDEGIAHLMEDLTGWGPSNVGAVSVALSEWPTATMAGPNDTVEQRGKAYLFLRHLVDRAAAAVGATSTTAAATTTAATNLVAGLLSENAIGFEHVALRNAGADGMGQWLQGVFASGRSDLLPDAGRYDYLNVARSATTDNFVGIATTGTFSSARGTDDVTLYGPTVGDGSADELYPADIPLDSSLPLSGSLFFLVHADGPGTMEFQGRGNAYVDLQLRAVQVQ